VNVAALVLWITTAIGGVTMAGIWVAHGGPSQHRDGASRLSVGRIGLHFVFAAGGLLLWIGHLIGDSTAVGWIAFAALPLAGLVGLLMFLTWLGGRGAAPASPMPAEQEIPPLVVAAHGALAVATVLVVLLALTR